MRDAMLLFLVIIICVQSDGQKTEFNDLSSTFSNAIRKPLPFTWQKSPALDNFRRDFADIIEPFLNKILLDYYVQGSDNSKRNYRIDSYIQTLSSRDKQLTNETANDILTKINSVLNDYFAVLPDDNDDSPLVFVDALPPFQPTDGPKNYELDDLFMNLDKILDGDLRKFYLLFGNLYLEGWSSVRPILKSVKNRFSKTYLQGVILERLVKGTNEIKAMQQVVQPLTDHLVWQNFSTYANNLEQLYRNNFITYN